MTTCNECNATATVVTAVTIGEPHRYCDRHWAEFQSWRQRAEARVRELARRVREGDDVRAPYPEHLRED